MSLTFLSAGSGQPLVKVFSPTEKKSYPNVKKFNSHTEEIEISDGGLQHMAEILKERARAGHCLLKGPLKAPLNNESRKGLADKDALTQLLVLDIDKAVVDFDLPQVMDADTLRMIDGFVIDKLPSEFGRASRIVQASASLGLNPKSISVHMYYFLDAPVHPRALKDYLTSLNFDEGFFEEQIRLTATNVALSYSVDRALADNSRLIYIGTPQFEDMPNPFPNDEDRIVFIQGISPAIQAGNVLNCSSDVVAHKQLEVLNRLRKNKGLKGKRSIKLDSVLVDGERIAVLAEPGRARMFMALDEGEYVRYNLNGGDSNAYWVYKHAPEIVHNFKGEPAFRFNDVDPEGYEEHKRRFTETTEEEADYSNGPLAFIDWHSQTHWGLVDGTTEEIIKLEPCRREAIRDLYAQYGISAPENLPVYEYAFRPYDDTVFDREKKFINKYRVPKLLRNVAQIPEEYAGHSIGHFESAKALVPTIYDLIYSVCGRTGKDDTGVREMEYFINWLAFIVQKRQKALTAWVFHGTQGTGKGIFFNKVLAPILGEEYTHMKRTQDIDDTFNGYIETALLIAVDEFRTEGKGVKTDLVNKIKNMVTEETGPIRAMRQDQYTAELFTNFLFFSNDKDAMRIAGDDRRFNIAPRQEEPILKRFPDIIGRVEANIQKEVPLFASYLLSYEVNEKYAKESLDNEAKEAMREAGASSVDQFVNALHGGQLDYFLTILDEEPKVYAQDYVEAAQNIVKTLIRDFEPGHVTKMWLTEIRPLYNVLVGKQDNLIKLGKMLAHHNLDTKKVRKGDATRAGLEIAWNLEDHDIDYLRERYISPVDRSELPQHNVHQPQPVH
jgi:hypothetical protein